jgi:hypothetical protein
MPEELGFDFWQGQEIFTSLQTGSEAHLASYPIIARNVSLGKVTGA